MLEINDLQVAVDGKAILNGLTLSVKAGEVHAIMGPNGSGKSTLAHVLAGRPGYTVTGGSATFLGKDLLAMQAHERVRAGLFLAFQYPVEIPGVQNRYFLRTAMNAQRKSRGEPELDAVQFLKTLKTQVARVGIDLELTKREVNANFSGGEKKRNEILQMAMLEPRLALLDEIDSGLDVDALRAVADGVNSLRTPERAMILVTHYQRLLDLIPADIVHVLVDGRIVKTGGPDLAREVETRGYDWVRAELAA